ncbi:MAG TPA: nuclear transport factor 2 family protein [Sporichthyaceae bacterium]|nr:nuclear transport factor 2 family protein [Sporichthyaceae bacterium]
MSALHNVSDPVAKTLERWHAMVAANDLTEVAELLHPDVAFSSPAFWSPYPGPVAVAHVLQTAVGVLATDFTYHRSFATDDGQHVVLEFSARLEELELKGIDMIAFDADGLITRFEVMIRPMKSLALLAERMGAAVNPVLLGKAPKP